MNVFRISLNLFHSPFSSLLYIILKSKNKVNHLYREFQFIFLFFRDKINNWKNKALFLSFGEKLKIYTFSIIAF